MVILGYPGGISLITSHEFLKDEEFPSCSQRDRHTEREMTTEKWLENSDFAGFEDGGRSHSPRDVRGLYKLQQARKQIVP